MLESNDIENESDSTVLIYKLNLLHVFSIFGCIFALFGITVYLLNIIKSDFVQANWQL